MRCGRGAFLPSVLTAATLRPRHVGQVVHGAVPSALESLAELASADPLPRHLVQVRAHIYDVSAPAATTANATVTANTNSQQSNRTAWTHQTHTKLSGPWISVQPNALQPWAGRRELGTAGAEQDHPGWRGASPGTQTQAYHPSCFVCAGVLTLSSGGRTGIPRRHRVLSAQRPADRVVIRCAKPQSQPPSCLLLLVTCTEPPTLGGNPWEQPLGARRACWRPAVQLPHVGQGGTTGMTRANR